MDPEELNNNGVGDDASSPLLVNEMEESSNDILSIRGGGEEEEQQQVSISERTEFSHDDSDESSHRANRCSGQCHKIPTLVFIIVPMIIFLIGVFLASAFMPHTTHDNEKKYAPTSSPPSPQQLIKKHNALHDDPISPTLLSIRDHINGGLMNVHTNYLYKQLKTATYHHKRESSMKTYLLQSNKNEVGYGEPLTIKWSSNTNNDKDIIALYCPASETNPKKFRDAATLAHVKATHNFYQGRNSEWLYSTTYDKVWTIPSFPIVREETCEFRMYTHSNSVDGTEEGEDDAGMHHYYTLVGATAIFLTSNQDPKGIHISLTGKVSEMFIQFNTGDSGESIVEYVKKSDINNGNNLDATQRAMAAGWKRKELFQGQELVSEISWTKVKGTSTTYAATDMCQEPATSTEPGFFVPPGYFHTVKLTNLEPNTEYIYKVGLGFGQGVKWSEDSFEFRTSAPPGGLSTSSDKPAVTFLAVADLGCEGATYRKDAPIDPDGANQVSQLITSIINKQTVDSVHLIGDLSYADGAAHMWDVFMNDVLQPYASRVPTMVAIGNNEYDHTEGGGGGKDPSGAVSPSGFQPTWGLGSFNSTGGECGVPIAHRFAAPDNGNGIFWYSFDQSLVHTVMISSEHNMTRGSAQYTWLEKDLAAVNRSITPWLVVDVHRPIYNSELYDWSQPMITTGMQNAVEDLLHIYQVDLVLSGHYHSYFRSCQGLYSHKCDCDGPTYITVGTGGAPLDGNHSQILPNQYTERFDKSKWGVGRASVYNSSMLHWEFVAVGGDVIDEVWLMRANP